jgi:D-alanyl-D-alanine carboxypeptidase
MRKFNSSSVSTYLNKMNNICKLKVKTQNTSFANPHGLSNVNSLSTAEDMARISSYGMKNKTFREVVLTKNYACKYTLLRASSREPEVQNNDEN